MLLLDTRETQTSSTSDEIYFAKQHFRQNDYLKFNDLVEEHLLKRIRKKLNKSKFREMSYAGISPSLELAIEDNSELNGLMHVIFNCEKTIKFVRKLTGVRSINSFRGRIYKMLPGHQHGWHDDNYGGRKLALSLNLGGYYEGGSVCFRNKKDHKVIHRVSNRNINQAILFKISNHLEHRTQMIKGKKPKVSFVGWFIES